MVNKNSGIPVPHNSQNVSRVNFGEAIKELRKHRGFSQGELGKLVGRSEIFIRKLESPASDSNSWVSEETVNALAEALGVEVCFIFVLSDSRENALVKTFQKLVRAELGVSS